VGVGTRSGGGKMQNVGVTQLNKNKLNIFYENCAILKCIEKKSEIALEWSLGGWIGISIL
jgi:hypothetical protein